MDELEQSFQKKQISENTKRNYKYAYNKLMNMTNNVLISNLTDTKIVKLMKQLEILPMSKNGMISVAINILKAYNKSTSSLEKYRETIIAEHYENKKNDTTITDKLVSIKQLKDYTKQLYKDGKYIDFIINYIMINYGVRNMDLDLIVVKDKNQVNDIDNFIYATTKYVVVVINKYKTASTYGKKRFTIYNNDLIRAVNNLLTGGSLAPPTPTPTQENAFGASPRDELKLINAVDINAYIQSRTLNNMGEGLVFKSIIAELAKHNNIDKIKKLSKHRGSDVNTIFKDYHIKI